MKLLKTSLVFSFIFSAFFLFSPKTFAHGDCGSVCKSDVEKFCSDVSGDRGAKMKCLTDHQKELSSECQAKMEKKKARREAFKKDCGADVKKFCSDVEPGHGGKYQCLKSHESELSATCKTRLDKKRK
jgi:hypothetical protein